MRTQQPRRATGTAALALKKAAADLICNEYALSLLIPLALIALYWLCEVSA